ncbi:MAG: hypothetical protein E7191_07420 [Erysipelotrichaceae bacterium]|nr:hypothetical protein [Erysipelotrichaceae bacterium]
MGKSDKIIVDRMWIEEKAKASKKSIKNALEVRLIKNGYFQIYVDHVVDTSLKFIEYDPFCCLYLKDYSEETELMVHVSYEDYARAKEDMQCMLVFTELNSEPFFVILGDEYSLDNLMQTKVIDSLEERVKR